MNKLFRGIYGLSTVQRCVAKTQLIGFIGLGNMGGPMAINLAKGGFDILGYDTSKQRLEELKTYGINPITDLKALAKESDVIITMLPNTKDVENTMLTQGIFSNAKKGALIIDSSTISPIAAKELNEKAKGYGINFVDAPVSGGVTGAAAGTLTFMVGAENPDIFSRCIPYLNKMGKNIVSCERPGAGQIAKICNNLALAIEMIGVSEALVLGKNLGIDLHVLTSIMKTSSSRCWSIDTYNPVPGLMENVPASRNYERGFGCSLILKDLRIAQEVAEKSGSKIPLGEHSTKLYENLVKEGLATKDFGIIYEWLSKGGK